MSNKVKVTITLRKSLLKKTKVGLDISKVTENALEALISQIEQKQIFDFPNTLSQKTEKHDSLSLVGRARVRLITRGYYFL